VELIPPASRVPSGRPGDDEIAAQAKPDIDQVVGDDAIAALTAQRRQTIVLVESLDEARVRGLTYAPGKWTLKEVLGHIADDERIYSYRALCIARGDAAPLPSFDEVRYVAAAGFETRSLASLLGEYRAVRQATIALLGGLPAEAWRRRGIVCDRLSKMPGVKLHYPDGAFYAFFDVSAHFKPKGVKDSAEFCAAALSQGHISLVAGSAFNCEGYVRMSYAASRDQLLGTFDRNVSATRSHLTGDR